MLFILSIMEKEKIISTVETVNKYFAENGQKHNASDSLITTDKSFLDEVTEKVISLICAIGIDENFAPNIHGVILDGCLEVLNQIREEYFNHE